MVGIIQTVRDKNGWRVPAIGTQARAIYVAMQWGLSARQIADLIGASRDAVRVAMWRIRHPDFANVATWRIRHRDRATTQLVKGADVMTMTPMATPPIFMRSGETDHVDLFTLKNWLANSRPGESFVYAIGDVATDRQMHLLPGLGPFVKVLDAVARQVMLWEKEGLVFAFQRRAAPDRGFTYIAVRSYRSRGLAASEQRRQRKEKAAMAAMRGGVTT